LALVRLDLDRAIDMATSQADPDDEETIELWGEMGARRQSVESEQSAFAVLCDHWDNLYYPQTFTKGGASHWADDPSAYTKGMTHISVNNYPTYVDIPAALTSWPPIENMLPMRQDDAARALASAVERVYFAWKDRNDIDKLGHRACTVKGLYGRTAAKVYWDSEDKYPKVEVVDQPRNLYLGWRDSNYSSLDWAIYSYAITPDTALEDWGLVVECGYDTEGKPYPYIAPSPVLMSSYQRVSRNSQLTADLRVEVNDYWYRRPRKNARIEQGKPVKFETCNAIFVGNILVKNEVHPEYRGQMPYLPLFNSYIPGQPVGRSALYDVEQLQREKDERLSENAQMIHKAVAGQYWQLTGPEAPQQVPAGLKPQANQIIAPGPGNRVEAMQPWMPEFQMEQYLTRIDRELTDISGLNEIMRGMAPSQVMNSGKAVAALVANYETRIAMPRGMYYDWLKAIWELTTIIWAEKDSNLKSVIDGTSRLNILSPSLTPRDDAETAQIASNMKEMKLWSSKRAMDRVGVEDPESEEDIIRSEQTDASLNPAAVQVMVSLMMMMQQMQQQMPPELAQQGAQAAQSTEQNLAAMRGMAPQTAVGPEAQGPGEQPVTPAEEMPGNTAQGEALGAGEPAPGEGAMPSQMLSQYQIQEGELEPRIVGQQVVQRTEEEA
jgi:hypothetical protein